MFTFVRVLSRNLRHADTVVHTCTTLEQEDDEQDIPVENPWKKELERLASCQCDDASWPDNRARPMSNAISSFAAKAIKQGTLADQRVWWGRAIGHSTLSPEQGFGLTGNRLPPKTIKRWQQ